MKFICYSKWDDLPPSANRLFIEHEKKSLFLSRHWLENITDYSLPNELNLILLCAMDDENILAILPMMKCPQGSLSALSTRFTSYYSLLLTNTEKREAALNCLAKGLSNMPVKPIQFEPIDNTDKNINDLQRCMQENSLIAYPYFRFHNWVHYTRGESFDEYMKARPSNLRNTVQRKQKKLLREHPFEIKLYLDTDIQQALTDYLTVYTNSWKANEYHKDFTPNLVKRYANLGWLRLGILYADSKPIAAQIWFVAHSQASIYRLVYDEKWKRYSPGSILTEYIMRYVIDTDKVSEIDFLTGDEKYKQDWMTIRRERIGIRFIKKNKPTSWLKRKLDRFRNLALA